MECAEEETPRSSVLADLECRRQMSGKGSTFDILVDTQTQTDSFSLPGDRKPEGEVPPN